MGSSSEATVSAVTTVVNINYARFDQYIGRGSPFGNPYPITAEEGRDEVIRKFEIDFHARLKMDADFLRRVLALEGKILGCHCKPLRCHGDSIVKFLNERASTSPGGHITLDSRGAGQAPGMQRGSSS